MARSIMASISAAFETMGMMIPAAPESRAHLTHSTPCEGMRTIGNLVPLEV